MGKKAVALAVEWKQQPGEHHSTTEILGKTTGTATVLLKGDSIWGWIRKTKTNSMSF